MPKTIKKDDNRQIIGGMFSDRTNAENAVGDLRGLGLAEDDIQVVVMLDGNQAQAAYTDALVGRGVSESQALFFDTAIRSGKILVAAHNVTDPAPVIEILDRNGAGVQSERLAQPARRRRGSHDRRGRGRCGRSRGGRGDCGPSRQRDWRGGGGGRRRRPGRRGRQGRGTSQIIPRLARRGAYA
ncbi:MAG: hypothetical protein WDO13_03695 [Verrucomicrobiota bacterium]